jgi:integrase
MPLKTGAGERDVYLIPGEVFALLKAHRIERLALGHAGPDDYLFGTRDGHPLTQRNACRAISSAGDAAKLNPSKDEEGESVSWHDLRHTFGSRLIALGFDVVVVQRQMGHAKPSITLDIYAHEFEKAQRSDDLRARIEAAGIGAALEVAS